MNAIIRQMLYRQVGCGRPRGEAARTTMVLTEDAYTQMKTGSWPVIRPVIVDYHSTAGDRNYGTDRILDCKSCTNCNCNRNARSRCNAGDLLAPNFQ